tara:strand:+ start:560 stop:793 length:234 start_codon:yes stop_codon:yes gene_type:complete
MIDEIFELAATQDAAREAERLEGDLNHATYDMGSKSYGIPFIGGVAQIAYVRQLIDDHATNVVANRPDMTANPEMDI